MSHPGRSRWTGESRRRGPMMQFDVAALRRKIGKRSLQEVGVTAGLGNGHVSAILKRGGYCHADTVDALCGALGIHESEVLA